MIAAAQLRASRVAFGVLALVIALGLGVAVGSLALAYRTQHAYPSYVQRADVADLVINPSLLTTDVDAVLRSLPYVRHVSSDNLFTAGVGDGHPRSIADLVHDNDPSLWLGSIDGRYVDVDRPVVTEGRAPTGRGEVFVTVESRPDVERRVRRRVHVGDRIPVSFWSPLDTDPTVTTANTLTKRVKPIGVEELRISGFGRLPDEVLNDDLFPRRRFVVSADVAARYDCLPKVPDTEDLATLTATLFPHSCSTSYGYYALNIAPGKVAAVERVFHQRIGPLNAALPKAVVEQGSGYYPIVTTRADEQRRVEQAIRPTVVALTLFGSLAAIATLTVAALAVARLTRQHATTLGELRTLGMVRRERALGLAVPYVFVGVVGVAGAYVFAYATSRFVSVAHVRVLDPRPTFSVSVLVAGLVLVAFGVLFAIAVATSAVVAARGTESKVRARRRSPGVVRSIERAGAPSIAEGVRSAFGARRGASAALVGGCCAAVAALVAATVFGAHLTTLVDRPERYGWPWDVGVLTNFGYGGTDRARVEADLAARDEVASWDYVALLDSRLENKLSVTLIAAGQGSHDPHLPVVDGRFPTRAGEVALGTTTAHDLGASIGDRIDVNVTYPETKMKANVVGTVVLPATGPFQSDRPGLGDGAFMIVPRGQLNDASITFVGIHLKHGADPTRTLSHLQPGLRHWDTTQAYPFIYRSAVRPPEIVNAESMRNGPLVLAAVLALALVVAIGLAIASSVNDRRRPLAILRAMGFTRGQVRRAVRWQALTLTTVGVAVGVPAGVFLGQRAWRLFAHGLGVAPARGVPVGFIALVVAIVTAGALVAAARPARAAARLSPAQILRTP
ncbi:MAG: putative transport system permease protein [Actinomycetota bacterium]|nr:putative transport system permease protein [Actinomycetota bacterium]